MGVIEADGGKAERYHNRAQEGCRMLISAAVVLLDRSRRGAVRSFIGEAMRFYTGKGVVARHRGRLTWKGCSALPSFSSRPSPSRSCSESLQRNLAGCYYS